jgi:glycosyltransferase
MPYLKDAIKSILLQDYQNYEIIVVESKSHDGTNEWLSILSHKKIKKFSYNNNKGKFSALNFGIKKSEGDIIGILHADDIMPSKTVLSEINNSFKIKKCDVLFGKVVFCERENLNNLKRYWNNKNIINKFNLPPHTGIYLKSAIAKKIKYSLKYKVSSDYDYILSLLKKNLIFYKLNRIVCLMRLGGESTNINFFLMKTKEDILILKKFFNNYLFVFIKKIIIKIPQLFKKIRIKKKFIEEISCNKINIIDGLKEIKSKNFILCGLNLAYLGFFKKISYNNNIYLWKDGYFSKKFCKNYKKNPGRDFIKNILNEKKLSKITIIGNLNEKEKNFLEKINKDILINFIKLPYFNKLEEIKDQIKLHNNDLIIITIPTPKQELLANYISYTKKNYKIICIGGGLAMASGSEKMVPYILCKINLEFLWRLVSSDFFRRIFRLFYTLLIFYKNFIFNKKSYSRIREI